MVVARRRRFAPGSARKNLSEARAVLEFGLLEIEGAVILPSPPQQAAADPDAAEELRMIRLELTS